VDLFSIFEKFPGLFIAMSLKEDGNMKFTDPEPDKFKYKTVDKFKHEHENRPANLFVRDYQIFKNRQIFLEKIGISDKYVVGVVPVHGSNTAIVTEKNSGTFIPAADGLITAHKSLFLSITVADCLPVIIYDPKKEVLALLHCGWKGLWKNIIVEAIKKINENFMVYPEKLFAGIGPGISNCHFEVREDLINKFGSFPEAVVNRGNHSFLDLKLIAKRQMEIAGLKSGNIEISPVCTFCESEKYFSHRKDKLDPVHAMMVIAGIY
jgi:polyphenol oxidase